VFEEVEKMDYLTIHSLMQELVKSITNDECVSPDANNDGWDLGNLSDEEKKQQEKKKTRKSVKVGSMDGLDGGNTENELDVSSGDSDGDKLSLYVETRRKLKKEKEMFVLKGERDSNLLEMKEIGLEMESLKNSSGDNDSLERKDSTSKSSSSVISENTSFSSDIDNNIKKKFSPYPYSSPINPSDYFFQPTISPKSSYSPTPPGSVSPLSSSPSNPSLSASQFTSSSNQKPLGLTPHSPNDVTELSSTLVGNVKTEYLPSEEKRTGEHYSRGVGIGSVGSCLNMRSYQVFLEKRKALEKELAEVKQAKIRAASQLVNITDKGKAVISNKESSNFLTSDSSRIIDESTQKILPSDPFPSNNNNSSYSLLRTLAFLKIYLNRLWMNVKKRIETEERSVVSRGKMLIEARRLLKRIQAMETTMGKYSISAQSGKKQCDELIRNENHEQVNRQSVKKYSFQEMRELITAETFVKQNSTLYRDAMRQDFVNVCISIPLFLSFFFFFFCFILFCFILFCFYFLNLGN
jgi:hypothetical protein